MTLAVTLIKCRNDDQKVIFGRRPALRSLGEAGRLRRSATCPKSRRIEPIRAPARIRFNISYFNVYPVPRGINATSCMPCLAQKSKKCKANPNRKMHKPLSVKYECKNPEILLKKTNPILLPGVPQDSHGGTFQGLSVFSALSAKNRADLGVASHCKPLPTIARVCSEKKICLPRRSPVCGTKAGRYRSALGATGSRTCTIQHATCNHLRKVTEGSPGGGS